LKDSIFLDTWNIANHAKHVGT